MGDVTGLPSSKLLKSIIPAVEAPNQNGACGKEGPEGSPLRRCRRLRSLIDSIYDAYYDWDIKSGRVEFSAQIGSFLGTDNEIMNTLSGWVDRLHPDDRENALKGLAICVREGGGYTAEYRMRRADGSYAYVRDRGVTLSDETGQPARLVGVMRDVTRERQAERALLESAEIYHTLFELAVNPAFHIDRHGRYVNSNEAGLSFLETTRENLVGQTLMTHWGSEALSSVKTLLAGKRSAIRLDIDADVNGNAKAAILTLIPCQLGGEPACFALATDITDRQALSRALEETNTALRVILEQRDQAREELERNIAENVETIVLPLLTRVANRVAGAPEATFLDSAVRNLREIVRPLGASLNIQEGTRLTPREREIAELIRAGKSTDEIARAFYISAETVAFHRKNLRRKLGLEGRGARLSTYLKGGSGQAFDQDTP